jgi:hypothetical protein
VPAGTYHFVLDCIITGDVTATFELLLRRGGGDTQLVTWSATYTPRSDGSFAPEHADFDEAAPAIDFEPGDQLVFRYRADAASLEGAYEPNGDGPGPLGDGRFPCLTLPN